MSDLSKGFNKVHHGIPDDSKLASMQFSDLAVKLSLCKKDSPKFMVVEREMKRQLAKDQAKVNRPNMILAAYIAGGFGLSGVVLGALLTSFVNKYTHQQVTPAATAQQVEKSDLGVKPPVTKVPQVIAPLIAEPPIHPEIKQKDAQQRKANP